MIFGIIGRSVLDIINREFNDKQEIKFFETDRELAKLLGTSLRNLQPEIMSFFKASMGFSLKGSDNIVRINLKLIKQSKDPFLKLIETILHEFWHNHDKTLDEDACDLFADANTRFILEKLPAVAQSGRASGCNPEDVSSNLACGTHIRGDLNEN